MHWLDLWLRFAAFIVGRVLLGRYPLTVIFEENLGRELNTKSLFAATTGRVRPNAFIPPKDSKDISVTRLSIILRALAIEIANRRAATLKSSQSFYGFAVLGATDVRDVGAQVKGTPHMRNPFHADIMLPPDSERDKVREIAALLAKRASLQLCR